MVALLRAWSRFFQMDFWSASSRSYAFLHKTQPFGWVLCYISHITYFYLGFMKNVMQKKFLAGSFFFLGAGLIAGIILSPHRAIVAAKDGVVAFADGTAQFVSNDDVPDQVPHIYTADMAALGSFPNYRVPNVIFQGGAWQREVYSYNDPSNEQCSQNILYKDRVKKIVKQLHVDYCLQEDSALDEHDITHFFATSADGKSIAVGTYEDGAIVASHAIPDGMMVHDRVFSWDLTRGIITFVSSTVAGISDSTDLDRLATAYSWDLSTGEWREVAIPQYTSPVDPTVSRFIYNHDKDVFEYYARLLVGKRYVESPAAVESVTEVK